MFEMASGKILKIENGKYSRLLQRHDVARIFGVTTRTIQRWEGKDGFPRPLRTGRSPRWLVEDIEKYTAAKIAEREAQR